MQIRGQKEKSDQHSTDKKQWNVSVKTVKGQIERQKRRDG